MNQTNVDYPFPLTAAGANRTAGPRSGEHHPACGDHLNRASTNIGPDKAGKLPDRHEPPQQEASIGTDAAAPQDAAHRPAEQPSRDNTPARVAIRLWSWWRLYAAYGNAIRDYAFAARNGRLKPEQLSASLVTGCEREIEAAARDQLRRSNRSAYGTSFPDETKANQTAGWYFSGDAAFDLAVACQLDYPVQNDPRPKFLNAILGNLNYEAGCNPVNMAYLTGVGWKRQRETVNQYALNDRRVLPPSGIPLGNIQGGFGWLELYGKELGALSFPPDGDTPYPYPFYDRWGDSFNLTQEFVILNQSRALAYLSWLMAQTPLKTQPWKSAAAQITAARSGQKVVATLSGSGLDLSRARIVWEAAGQEPAFGKTFSFVPGGGPQWIEAEAQLPDGRRVFAVTNSIPK